MNKSPCVMDTVLSTSCRGPFLPPKPHHVPSPSGTFWNLLEPITNVSCHICSHLLAAFCPYESGDPGHKIVPHFPSERILHLSTSNISTLTDIDKNQESTQNTSLMLTMHSYLTSQYININLEIFLPMLTFHATVL